MTGADAVGAVTACMDPESYAAGPEGRTILQRTRPVTIEQTLRLLDWMRCHLIAITGVLSYFPGQPGQRSYP